MENVSATDAARRFSELLDAIEHRRESFVISRRGRPVARIGPAAAATGKAAKAVLRRHPRDRAWAADLAALREDLSVEERRWTG
ncbi:MAG: type II toxin-antitoxin system Phd/YefM family antitoxin [Actinomycetota bacterium]